MEATLKIQMDNAAFEGENAGPELVRILRDAASRLEAFGEISESEGFSLRDVNGNKVGRIDFMD